jgi:hypothetical protein
MAKLTEKGRKALPSRDFAGPGRSFPIENKAHARAALQDLPRDKSLTLREAQKIHAAATRKLKGK